MVDSTTQGQAIVERLVDGDQRALPRAITIIENREPGYKLLVGNLYTCQRSVKGRSQIADPFVVNKAD